MNEKDLSFRIKTLFEQLRLDGKSRGGDIRLDLNQQEEIVKGIKELEDYSDYLFHKCMDWEIE